MNIEKLRSETPGCKEKIHFNNAGAALISAQTLKIQQEYLLEEAEIGSYECAVLHAHEINLFYDHAAALINAQPNEIAFMESATVGWQRAFWSIEFNEGDEIICDSTSYASNYIAFINAKRRFKVNIRIIGQSDSGAVNLEELESSISSKTKLISITHMPTNGGLVNPAEEIGAIAKRHNILYQLDACQSVGQYPIDVKRIKCDFLSTTGRKYLRGPRGTGFLYVNSEVINHLTPQSLDLHSAEWVASDTYEARNDAKRFETWECNPAAKLGLSNAILQTHDFGIEHIWQRVVILAEYLREKLESIEQISVTDIGQLKSGIVTFKSNITPVDQLKTKLLERNINTVVAIKSGTLIDMETRELGSILRASIHYYNTHEEIDIFIETLRAILDEDI